MKKLSLVIILIIATALAYAQPQKFNYQGVARNSSGNPLASQTIALRISILDGSASGPVLYSETHSATTNSYGLYNVAVGGGTIVTGTMGSINWAAGDRFVKVEIDPVGGTSFVDLGATQLLSVPYALSSGSASLSGTPNYVPKFSGANSAVNSTITDDGTNIGLGSNLTVSANGSITHGNGTNPMTYMFTSGTTNADRMIVAHSPAWSNWGLMYTDNGDRFHFLADGMKKVTIDPGGEAVGIGVDAQNPPKGLTIDFASTTTGPFHQRIIARGTGLNLFPGLSLTCRITGALGGVNIYGALNNLNVADTNGINFKGVNASAFNVMSDRRMKRTITTIGVNDYDDYMDQIRSIESATYYYNNETDADRKVPHVGFIAQSLPVAVQTEIDALPGGGSTEKRIGYNLSDFAGLSLIGIKALDHKQQEMEKKIQSLEERIAQLDKLLQDK